MNNIQIFDNIFSPDESSNYHDLILHTLPFFYGEVDRYDTSPTGMVCDITDKMEYLQPDVHKFMSMLIENIHKNEPKLKDMTLYRMYINLFIPKEIPYFHIDGENTVTCLYYVNSKTDYDDGGETQFIIDNDLKCVRAIPGRLVIFDGEILHRATSFRNQPRLTIAFKFKLP